MNIFKKLVPQFPVVVYVVILCAFFKAIAYWTLTPYLPMYLKNIIKLDTQNIGYLIGLGSFSGTIMSVFCGYLIDHYNKRKIYILSLLIMTIGYFCFGFSSTILILLLLLIITNISSSSLSIVSNTWFSILLTEEESTKAFSLKYILENIGAMIGPILGTLLIGHNLHSPFLIAAGGLFITTIIFLICPKTLFKDISSKKEYVSESSWKTIHLLIADKRLLYFTVGGIFSMMVYGALVNFMSLFFSVILPYETAYQYIAYISALNAVIVLTAQYFISSIIKINTIMQWIRFSVISMSIGLIILMLNTNLTFLTISIVLLSFGEITIVPAEYLFIIKITSESKRALYLGAQNLIYLGLSFTPMLCGFLLSNFTPQWMFLFLILCLCTSLYFYSLGYQKSQYFPKVIHVAPHKDYTVSVYFSDGKIVIYDVAPLLDKGVFSKLKDIDIFLETCTILNDTLAWNITGDKNECIDIDPDTLYQLPASAEQIA